MMPKVQNIDPDPYTRAAALNRSPGVYFEEMLLSLGFRV